MSEPTKFDADLVGSLLVDIGKQIAFVEQCRKDAAAARDVLNRAEVNLANLRIELTRLVDGQLDFSTLRQRAPEQFAE